MKKWWKRRSLKLRLALWYAAATALVLILFVGFFYETIEVRLRAEIDRQLRIDFDLVEAQLTLDDRGRVSWLMQGAHGNEGFARLSAWFEVWSDDGQVLLRHWPVAEQNIRDALPAPKGGGLFFRTDEIENLHVRVMERPARVNQRGVILRLIREETEMRHALAQIVEVAFLMLPFAVLGASLGGYLLAQRSFALVAKMAVEAGKITSESLSGRLPNPNPHDELGQLAAVFNETLERLEASFAELKRFTADASHELRTPLTALRAVGEVALREGGDAAVLRETIASMLEEAQRLHELIESLLALARMEGGKEHIALQPVVLSELAAEVKASIDLLATDKKQTVELQGDQSVTARADRTLLRQALLNIVHNALHYSPAESSVVIRVMRREGEALISVRDQGPGIAPEHRLKIFDRFYRIDPSRARAFGGQGLGLAIAKCAVEHQGGRIELESSPGEGSTFRIVLRLP